MLKLTQEENISRLRDMAAATFPLFRSKKLDISESQSVDETYSQSLQNIFSNPSYFRDPQNQLVKLVQP